MRKNGFVNLILIGILSISLALCCTVSLAEEKEEEFLPSWNDGATKSAILDYLMDVTSADSDTFLEKDNRIAVFRDNGTLIAEDPGMQNVFLVRSLKRLAKKKPELLRNEPYKSVEEKGIAYMDGLDAGMLEKIGGIVREEAGEEFYKELVSDFLNAAKHPHFDLLYKNLVYQPMKELISYLRAMGFRVYVVSSGDIAFVKSVSEALYDIAAERIISLEELKADPVKRPILAAGRMDQGQDVGMLLYCQGAEPLTLQMILKHDDKERELVYGQNDLKSIDAAKNNGWLQVSIKNDWKKIFPVTLKEKAPEKEFKPVKDEGVEELEIDVSEEAPAAPQIGITRPLEDKGPTKIDVVFFIIDIDEIDTVTQSFAANIFTAFRWWDPRLAHGGKGTLQYNLNDIWYPRILLMNRQRLWKSFPRVAEVNSSGEIIYRQRSWGYFSQPLDLRDFPFDKQTLNFTFVTPGYSPQEVQLMKFETKGFGMAENFSVPDWDVIGWDYTTKPFSPSEGEEIGTITFSLKLKRHSEHYVYKVVIPLVFIVFMSWIVFWIDPKEIGTNVAAATTSFLTLIAYRFAIGTFLPKIPYFTRLDAFVFWSTILVFSSLLQSILMSNLVYKDKGDLARKIEAKSRFIYPVVFVVIIVLTLFV
jgi:hypothetical protein